MIIDEAKLEKQEEFRKRWIDNNYVGTWEMATGGGKTYGAIRCLKMFPKLFKLIVVPTKYLLEQWKSELNKHHVVNWKVVVIHTAIKSEHKVGILVLDEIHRYASEKFSSILDLVSFTGNKMIIGLTATLKRQDKMHYILENYSPTIYKVNIKEALKDKLTPEFIIYNLPIRLTETEKKEYKTIDKSFSHFFGFFEFDFQEAMGCLQSTARRQAHSSITGIDTNTIHLNAINFSRAMGRRKSFLHNLPEKLQVVKRIVEHLDGKKIITFSELVKTTKELQKVIPGSKTYYATDKKEKKEKLMRDYDNSKFNVLHTAKAMDEGMDIPSIEVGIIHSSTSTARQTTQRVNILALYKLI